MHNYTADSTEYVSWSIDSVASDISSKSFPISLSISEPPLDKNSRRSALFAQAGDQITLFVKIEKKVAIVEPLLGESDFYASTQDTIKLFQFASYNDPNVGQADDIFMDYLGVSFLDQRDSLITDISTLFSSLIVRQIPEDPENNKKQPDEEFVAEQAVNAGDDLVTISQTQDPLATVPSNERYVFTVYGKLNDQVQSATFRLAVQSMAFRQVNDRLPILLKDLRGNELTGPEDFANFISTRNSVINIAGAEKFVNYPNPFSLRDVRENDGTTWSIYLEKETESIEIKIYNLLGERVRTLSNHGITGSIPSGSLYQGMEKWDGKNGVGNDVINGVYVAVATIKFSDGSTQKAKNKVVFIK